METCSSEPQLQQPDKSKDDDRDNIAKTSWQDVRGECSGRQWGMCTIGCMYREQVDGPGGYDDTAMAVEQPSRADRGSAATEYVPAPLAIQKRLLVCQKGKGGGGRRAASGPRCAAARPCWLADREDEGRATYREGPSQTGAAAGCRGMGAGRHLAGLRARPAYTLPTCRACYT